MMNLYKVQVRSGDPLDQGWWSRTFYEKLVHADSGTEARFKVEQDFRKHKNMDDFWSHGRSAEKAKAMADRHNLNRSEAYHVVSEKIMDERFAPRKDPLIYRFLNFVLRLN